MATFALNYNRKNKYMQEVSEIIIKFHKSNNFLNFLKEHSDQRIIVSIENGREFLDEGGLDYFKLIKQLDVTNYAIRFPSLFDENTVSKEELEEFKNANIPFFINDYLDRWDMLYGYINLGVTDIYAANELGFELDKVHKIAAEHEVNVRVIPNIAQTSWYDTPDLVKFFIRPEDIIDYEPYVDIFELSENMPERPQIGNVLYKAYAIDKRWFGQLNEIIAAFDNPLNGEFTHPAWSIKRVTCSKKCMKGGRCRMCYTVAGFAETLEKVGVTIKKKTPEKEKPKRTKEELQELILKYYSASTNPINLDDILKDANDIMDKQ